MRTVRIIDRGSAQQHGLVPVPARDVARRKNENEPGKPSIDDKRFYYACGPGWIAAYNEARRLMASGVSVERAAPQVGWAPEDLEAAIRRDGRPPPPPLMTEDDFRPKERARRTVKQRVAGLHGVSQETQNLARRLYEIEIMTVREVAKALGLPYEKCYLVLILAKTKFRRPGRRGSSESDDVYRATGENSEIEVEEVKIVTPVEVVAPPKAVRARPVAKVDVRFGTKKAGSQATEAEKALRRVLGAAYAVKSSQKASRNDARVAKKPASGRTRKKLSEAEKALRRVLG